MPKYNSIETIPASVFFEIQKTKNYQLLKPKPRENGLDKLFLQIYDDYFIKSENSDANRFLELTKEIGFLVYKKNWIKKVLHFLTYTPHTKEHRELLINSLIKGTGISFDLNADFKEEVLRVLTVDVGGVNMDIKFAELELEEIRKTAQNKEMDFYSSIAIMSDNLPNNPLLKQNMSLAVYVELDKLMRKKAKK